jgi:hypothetical protein
MNIREVITKMVEGHTLFAVLLWINCQYAFSVMTTMRNVLFGIDGEATVQVEWASLASPRLDPARILLATTPSKPLGNHAHLLAHCVW